MKKITFIIIALLISYLFAQNNYVKKITEITNLQQGEFYHARFSNDDSKIFFTKVKYQGIYYYDLSDKKIKIVTEETGAGYEYSLSKDGNIIYYRVDNYVNGKKYSSLKSKNLIDLKTETVVSNKRDISPPKVLDNGNVAYNSQNNLESFSGENLKNILSQNNALAFIEDQKIALYVNGEKKILTPKGEGNYIWPSVSPDKTKLLFTFAGRGTFVSDLNGNIISELGYANAPVWSSDGKWIIYMVDGDNGFQVTSSDIFISSVDGNTKIEITNTPNIFEMYPDINKAGSKIVCGTDDGKIFLIELNNEF